MAEASSGNLAKRNGSSDPAKSSRRDVAPSSDPIQKLSVRALVGIGRLYSHVFHRLEVRSACMLPRTGPAILVCNHVSGLDPVLVQSAVPRLVTWMMAKEYYDQPAMRWGFELIEAIPVERSGKDLTATRMALRALHAGRVLGVFPEGKIERTRELLPFQPGVAMMAHRTGADVYPAYLDGTQRGKPMTRAFLQPQSARLTFGPRVPLHFDGRRPDLDAAAEAIQGAVERLRRAASSLLNR